jgi:acyl-homoserine-lactone acylase
VTSYDAEIIWTTHGVPHITAADWGGLGFGQGYACARDRLPTIADHILKVRGERSRFLGAGFADRHLNTDLGYRVLGIEGRAAAMAEAQSDRVRAMVAGYAAGYNEALSEFGTSHLPQWCVDAPWIRPISEDDLYRLYVDLCLMASGRNLVEYLGSATAPDSPGGPATPPEPPSDGEVVGESHLGSNGWALGAAATGGPGMVMANPHFPWYGEGKLWECHLRIPGEIDVYGAALVGSPGVHPHVLPGSPLHRLSARSPSR